jgi:hypothetical protein
MKIARFYYYRVIAFLAVLGICALIRFGQWLSHFLLE